MITTETLLRELTGGLGWDRTTILSARLVLAASLGAVVGWEREREHRAAGLRTHMLVAMGASLFTLVAGFDDSTIALSNVAKGIAAGVGFLGAGTILKPRRGGHEAVQGLTTAANVWVTAAIGFAAGAGFLLLAAVATTFALVILRLLAMLESRSGKPRREAERDRR